MKWNKHLLVGLGILVLLLGSLPLLTSCGKQASGQTTIVVGTSGSPKPFSYVNGKQKLVGYDVDMVRAIDRELPHDRFTFKKTEFSSILEGLDSGRYQMGANNFAANAQRRKKYYFSKPIFRDQYVLVVQSRNTDMHHFDDIAGKTTVNTPGINFTTAIEQFNKTASVKSKITYSQEDASKQLQDVQDGKVDYVLMDKPLYNNYQSTYHFKNVKAIDLDISDTKKISPNTPYDYLLIAKTPDGKKLLKQVNRAITKTQQNGTAQKLSQKYFHGDYVPKQ